MPFPFSLSNTTTCRDKMICELQNHRESTHTTRALTQTYLHLHNASVCVRERDRVHWTRAEHTWHKWIFSYSEKTNHLTFYLTGKVTLTPTHTCKWGQLEVRNHYVVVECWVMQFREKEASHLLKMCEVKLRLPLMFPVLSHYKTAAYIKWD